MSTAATKSITSRIHNLTLSNPDPRFVKLPDITYGEFGRHRQAKRPAENNLPTSTDAEMADLGRCGHDLPTYNEPPFCYGEYAQHDDNRYSTAPRIDNVTIPPHLVNLIKRDAFDMGDREGRITGVNWDVNDYSLFRGKYHELQTTTTSRTPAKGKLKWFSTKGSAKRTTWMCSARTRNRIWTREVASSSELSGLHKHRRRHGLNNSDLDHQRQPKSLSSNEH
jgi:hypothetical protein